MSDTSINQGLKRFEVTSYHKKQANFKKAVLWIWSIYKMTFVFSGGLYRGEKSLIDSVRSPNTSVCIIPDICWSSKPLTFVNMIRRLFGVDFWYSKFLTEKISAFCLDKLTLKTPRPGPVGTNFAISSTKNLSHRKHQSYCKAPYRTAPNPISYYDLGMSEGDIEFQLWVFVCRIRWTPHGDLSFHEVSYYLLGSKSFENTLLGPIFVIDLLSPSGVAWVARHPDFKYDVELCVK